VAPFTQDRQIGLLASTIKSDGELTLVLPDRLRWELKPPDGITYWITPQGFAFATASGSASAGKSAAGKFGDVLGDLMTLLSGDLNKLRARYDFSVPSKSGDIVLVAIPKIPSIAKQVKRLELTAGADLWTVKKIVIEEQSGDKSVIVFGQLQRDVKVDPTRMQPPKP
jgi:outer membrane lipoprotein-sorting protein